MSSKVIYVVVSFRTEETRAYKDYSKALKFLNSKGLGRSNWAIQEVEYVD